MARAQILAVVSATPEAYQQDHPASAGLSEVLGLRAAIAVVRSAKAKLAGIAERVQQAEADKATAEAKHLELVARVSAGEAVSPKESREIDEAIRDAISTASLYRSAIAAAQEDYANAEETELVIRHGAWMARLAEHDQTVRQADARVREVTADRDRLAQHVAGLHAGGIVGDPVFQAHIASHEGDA